VIDSCIQFTLIGRCRIGRHAADPGKVLILLPDARFGAFIAPAFARTVKANTLPGLFELNEVIMLVTDPDWRWKGIAALALEHAYMGESQIQI